MSDFNWDALQEGFYDFLSHVQILSKDEGRVRLRMYDAQRYFFDEIFDGLRNDIHWFVCGKGRQLGITTACLMFDTFYAGAMPDVQGGIVFDTTDNKEKFRKLLDEMMMSLPPSHALPIRKGGNNRAGITFENGNMLDYLVAGIKRGTGTLGNSRALNFSHASECAYYGDSEAVQAYKNVLSDVFPTRLYIFESTAKGYNLFYDLWEEAVADEVAKKAIFIGWWRKRTYSHAKGTPLFQRYGWPKLSDDERERSKIVDDLYGAKITIEQWAWYRHRADPAGRANEEENQSEQREMVAQEHPTHPEEMFRESGNPFIPSQYLDPAMKIAQKAMFKGYRYHLGDDISTMRLEKTKFVNQTQMRVWQEPSPTGVYIVAADTAFGISDDGDAQCAQVVRCYADKMVQVAEFCDRSVQPFQFAWILLHLCGWYGDCRFILELNGAGEAVWTELKNLKQRVENGSLYPPRPFPGDDPNDEDTAEARNTYARVRQYLFRRSDSLGGGMNWQMRTSLETKFNFMTQFADRFMLGQFDIFSVPALKEMQTLNKDGRMIHAAGKGKDDRPVTLGLATRAYIDDIRAQLVGKNMTFEAEELKAREGGETLHGRFLSSIMERQFALKAADRRAVTRRKQGKNWSW